MILIHEELCTVVFSTVSAYSVWFVLHWFTYGAGVLVYIILLSEELEVSEGKNQTPALFLFYSGFLLVFLLYLFLLPCVCAARITSHCAGKIEVQKTSQ